MLGIQPPDPGQTPARTVGSLSGPLRLLPKVQQRAPVGVAKLPAGVDVISPSAFRIHRVLAGRIPEQDRGDRLGFTLSEVAEKVVEFAKVLGIVFIPRAKIGNLLLLHVKNPILATRPTLLSRGLPPSCRH
jgi:hypothetical protein